MTTFKEYIHKKCLDYSQQDEAVFLGYNTAFGSQMYGTLAGIDRGKLLEMPICENLMVSMAIGMALEGLRPVVCFERHDFLLLALDALVNHLDKMPKMSGGQFKLPVVIRAIVGGKEPIDPGEQHTQDYTNELRSMLKYTQVYRPVTQYGFDMAWGFVNRTISGAVVIVEHRDWYDAELIEKLPAPWESIDTAKK